MEKKKEKEERSKRNNNSKARISGISEISYLFPFRRSQGPR